MTTQSAACAAPNKCHDPELSADEALDCFGCRNRFAETDDKWWGQLIDCQRHLFANRFAVLVNPLTDGAEFSASVGLDACTVLRG